MQKIIEIAAQKYMAFNRADLNMPSVVAALQDLLPTTKEELDMSSLVERFLSNGAALKTITQTWLDDGKNLTLSSVDVVTVFGLDQIEEFANKLGISVSDAVAGLTQLIPDLVDRSSASGALIGQATFFDGKKAMSGIF